MELGILVWFALCICAGWFASTKGRSGIGIFFLSLFLSPLVGFIAALMENKTDATIKEKEWVQMKECPKCAESIKWKAIVCRYCGNEDFPKIKQQKSPYELKTQNNYYGSRKGEFCNDCGRLTVINDICTNCGGKSKRFCVSCSTMDMNDAGYCDTCKKVTGREYLGFKM